jgi:3-hydroxy-9,10-secoandrosta-1,3,5(10)-triene-9,17-dione monooxygenase reductase component
MSIAGEEFRTVLGRVPTSVVVVSGHAGGKPVGVSVGSFSSVSLDPPLVGFFIAKSSRTWPLIEPSGAFAVSVLSADQEPVSRVFATSGADKFAAVTYQLSDDGCPLLDDAAAWIECRLSSTSDAGDHLLVLGEVIRLEANGNKVPLLFTGGTYGRMSVDAGTGGPSAWD